MKKYLFLLFFLFFGFITLVFISWRQSVFKSGDSFSWMIVEDEGGILIVAHQGNDLPGNFFYLPPELSLETANGLGLYAVKNIYLLGEQQKINAGELLRRSIEQSLFIPVDKYIHIGKLGRISDNPGWLVKKSLLVNLFGGKSDLSAIDKIQLLIYFFTRKSISWDYSDMSKYLKQNQSGDYVLDEKTISDKLLYAFADKNIIGQDFSLAILDKSSCSGASAKAVSFMQNLGAYAYDIKGAQNREKNSRIYIDKKLNKKELMPIILRLKRLLQLEISDQDPPPGADIVLVLGDSFCHF